MSQGGMVALHELYVIVCFVAVGLSISPLGGSGERGKCVLRVCLLAGGSVICLVRAEGLKLLLFGGVAVMYQHADSERRRQWGLAVGLIACMQQRWLQAACSGFSGCLVCLMQVGGFAHS